MRLEQSFEVPVPIAAAWSVLLDVEQIAPCMPGATLTGYDGTAFTGMVKVKLGPVVMSFKGSGRFVERDESARRVVIVASGQETKGAGGAQATVTAVLRPDGGGGSTQVNVVADVEIAGKAAQFGRGMIADVNRKLVKQFADCLAATIAAMPAGAAEPAGMAAASTAAPATEASAPVAPEALVTSEAAPVPPAALVAPAVPPEAAPVTPAAPAAPPVQAPPAPAAPVAPAAAEAAPAAAEAAPAAPAAAEAAPAAPAPPPAPLSRPIEGEPIDLLAVTGARGTLRRAAPVIAIVLIIIAAVVVYLALS